MRCYENNPLVRKALEEPGHGRVLVVDGGASECLPLPACPPACLPARLPAWMLGGGDVGSGLGLYAMVLSSG